MSAHTLSAQPAELIKADTALRSFRDGGYILADAVGEMVDNRQQSGATELQTAAALAALAANLVEQKKYADADPVLRECLAIRFQKDPEDWTTFNTQLLLGIAVLGQKKYSAAEPLLLAAYAGLKQHEAEIPEASRSVRLTQAVEQLVALYVAWGKEDEADKWRQKRPPVNPVQPKQKSIQM